MLTEAAFVVVAIGQTAIGYLLGRAISMRRRAASVERAVLPNPRGLRAICMIHVFDDKDGVVHTTVIPNAPAGAVVDWPAVGDAIADAAGRIAHSGVVGEADDVPDVLRLQ